MIGGYASRETLEDDIVGLVVIDNSLLKDMEIKPRYFKFDEPKKLLEQLIEVNKQGKTLTPLNLIDEYKEDFNSVYYNELLTNTLDISVREQFFEKEHVLLNLYKEEVINQYTKDLEIQKINYNEFMKKMKEISSVEITEGASKLTEKELTENLKEGKHIKIECYPHLSSLLSLVEGDFLIIGSTTGNGKSGFLLNLMNDLMNRYQCIYFNEEMSKTTIYKRMISINQGLSQKHSLSAKGESISLSTKLFTPGIELQSL